MIIVCKACIINRLNYFLDILRMSKNELGDFKNLENHTWQHDALKSCVYKNNMTAYYFSRVKSETF